MSTEWRRLILSVALAALLAASACVPATSTNREGAGMQNSDDTPIVISNDDLLKQPGSTAPGGAGDQPQTTRSPGTPGNTIVYADTTYKFSAVYPAEFIFRTQPSEKLAELKPKPAAAFTFMNPKAASSDVAEPADLEIRVYNIAAGVNSLDGWLDSVGLKAGANAQSFQTANVSGVELCASTMIAPGCSYFVIGSDHVYQLRPASLAGESIIKSFMLLP